MRFRTRESRGDRRSLRSSRATVGSDGPRAAYAAASRGICASRRDRFKGNARAKPRARRARQAKGRAAKSLSRADGPGDAPVHLGGFGRKRKTRARFTSGMACRRAPANDLGADCCPSRAVRPHRLSRRAAFHPGGEDIATPKPQQIKAEAAFGRPQLRQLGLGMARQSNTKPPPFPVGSSGKPRLNEND